MIILICTAAIIFLLWDAKNTPGKVQKSRPLLVAATVAFFAIYLTIRA
jgi:hypothetical protein